MDYREYNYRDVKRTGCSCGCGKHCGHRCMTDDCDCNECDCPDCMKNVFSSSHNFDQRPNLHKNR